jgi:hypothetical protein
MYACAYCCVCTLICILYYSMYHRTCVRAWEHILCTVTFRAFRFMNHFPVPTSSLHSCAYVLLYSPLPESACASMPDSNLYLTVPLLSPPLTSLRALIPFQPKKIEDLQRKDRLCTYNFKGRLVYERSLLTLAQEDDIYFASDWDLAGWLVLLTANVNVAIVLNWTLIGRVLRFSTY